MKIKTLYTSLFLIGCLSSIYGQNLKSFSFEEMEERRFEIKKEISRDALKYQNPLYQRCLTTISCRDSDNLLKEENAGNFIFEDGETYQIMHTGIKILKDCYYASSSWMTDIIYALRGHHEPQEEKAFSTVLDYIEPGATIIELGCYWAYYSLWFATSIPQSVQYLIEPCLVNLKIGEHNFQANNCYSGNFIHGYCGKKYTHTNETNLRHIQIDKFIKKNNINHVAILHSDIQGEEYNMLLGCKESLKNKLIDFLFISTHSNSLHTTIINYLKQFGYIILVEHNLDESFSVDGLIVAKSPKMPPLPNIQITKKK